MAAFSRRAAIALGLLLAATPVAAQAPVTVLGRVVRFAGADTLPIPAAEVVLHRIGQATQGAIDSLRADPQGRFRFRFVTDSGALYLLSAHHHGITYFSTPVARDPTRVDDILLIVSDTSSTALVQLAARSLVIGAAEPSGHRMVVEVLEFANRGRQTRVGTDSVPSMAVALARGGEGFLLEDTDLSPEAVVIRNDSLLVFAPLSPGGRMAIIQYRLPAGTRRLELPAGLAVDTMQVLLEPGGLDLVADLPAAGEQVIEGRTYQRWMGPWPADRSLLIQVTGVSFDQRSALAILVVALAVSLAGGMVWIRHRRAAPVVAFGGAGAGASAEALVEAIARLDARYRGTQGESDPAGARQYQVERARLKRELERALAGRRTPP